MCMFIEWCVSRGCAVPTDYRDGVKEASLTACCSALESCIVTVELLGRDFPACLDYLSLRAIVRAMRDAAEVTTTSLKIVSAEGKVARWIGRVE